MASASFTNEPKAQIRMKERRIEWRQDGEKEMMACGGGKLCSLNEVVKWRVRMKRRRRQTRRRNLDEEEELSEAGQQRQKAPQDTVVHVPQLMTETGGGREDRGVGGENQKIQAARREKKRKEIKKAVRKQKEKDRAGESSQEFPSAALLDISQ